MDDMLCKKCGMTFDSRAVYGYACPHGSNCGPIEPRTELWLDPMPRFDVSLPPPVGYVTREEYDRLRDELTKAKAVLREHHEWHLKQEPNGDDDPASDYAESGLCTRTEDALALLDSPPPSSPVDDRISPPAGSKTVEG